MSAKLFPNQRTLFLLIARGNSWFSGPMPLPGGKSLLEAVGLRIQWGQKISETIQHTRLDEILPLNSGDFECYDWELDRLEDAAPVRSVPKPGVVFAIDKDLRIKDLRPDADGLEGMKHSLVLAQLIKNNFPLGGNLGDTIRNCHLAISEFLKTPDANEEPSDWDVFLSYCRADRDIANELRCLMQTLGLRSFMDEDIVPGKEWDDAIRQAIKGTLVGTILLTPNSINSKWVMCEAGAFWVLEKPIIPAWLGVRPTDFPELIAMHQGIPIDTLKQRQDLAHHIDSLCRS